MSRTGPRPSRGPPPLPRKQAPARDDPNLQTGQAQPEPGHSRAFHRRALTAGEGQQTYEDLFPNAKLIEHGPGDAVRVRRQGQDQMLRAHKGLSLNLLFRRGLVLGADLLRRLERGCFEKHELRELSPPWSLEGSAGAKSGPPAQNDRSPVE